MYSSKCLLLYLFFLFYYDVFCQGNYDLIGIPCTIGTSNGPGECLYYKDCEDARRLYETQRIRPTICGYTISHTIVCCPSANQKLKSISEKKCDQYASEVSTKVEVYALGGDDTESFNAGVECKFNSNPLIVGGEEAAPGEFPHMAAIGWLTLKNTYLFQCGGTLISERYVLSAAHCTVLRGVGNSSAPSIVRIGDHDLNSHDDDSSPQDINIANIIFHPDYTSKTKYNDIALFYLATSVRFNNFARPACLWRNSVENNKDVVATGWGVTESGSTSTSNVLQKVTLQVVSNEECRSLPEYKNIRRLPNGIIDTQLCAGVREGGKDTCQGDSGGPLQFVTKNRCIYHIAGITSFGKVCGSRGSPGVYTKVSKYVPWIENIVWPNE